MKPKKGDDHLFIIQSIEIFLEDIENIIKIMSHDGKEKLEISDESFEYDSLDNLKQRNNKILKKLKIRTDFSTISLEIGVLGGVRLFADSKEEISFLMLKSILLKRKRWLSLLSSTNLILSTIIIFIILTKIPQEIFKLSPFLSMFGHIYIAIFILFIVEMVCLFGNLASIDLFYSHERQSFWSRNKDQIIIAIGSAIIGAVIGAIAVLSLSRFFNKI
jgi:hypothetical protein